MNAKQIDLEDAIIYAREWQEENPTHAKAFLIPSNDLIACLEEMNVLVKQEDGHYTIENVTDSGVRAYMAIKKSKNNPPSAETEKLLIVGTVKDCNGIYRDIIENEKPSGCSDGETEKAVAALEGSGVFDFTSPCPSTCDPNSPLYNP